MINLNVEDDRITQYNNDAWLKKQAQRVTDLQVKLFTAIEVFDPEINANRLELKPLFDNAKEILDKEQKKFNDYIKEHYSDLFPGKY